VGVCQSLLLNVFIKHSSYKKSTKYQQNLSKLSSFTQEYFSGIRVIKAYALEEDRNKAFTELSRDSKTKNLALAKTNALFGPLMVFLIGLSYLIIILVGGNMYQNGEIKDLGVIAQFLLYIGMLVWPVASFGWVSSLVQEAEASQKRINEFLKEIPEIQDTGTITAPIQGTIEFKNVSYTYEDTGIKALSDISFSIPEGKTLAILGHTGSGKSTVLALLTRIHDIHTGQILIDNHHLKDYKLEHLRKNISSVPQDPFLFSDTLKSNISFGKNQATEEEIIAAAKQAAVHENIEGFANKYDTILGERGITLSGGQKQRVSLCRALMNKPKILLMDEPLSALDVNMRTKLQNEILTLHKEFNTTTIMVSHDPSEIYRLANRVVVLDDGQIINDGLPKNILLKTKGSQKFSFEGELLDIIKVDVIHIAIVSIGQQLVEIVVGKEEIKNLIIGQKVALSTKAFTPNIQSI
jgi:ATP-binding cassette subfamily B protein